MRDNRHTRAIPESVLSDALTKASELAALLKPYLLALTPTERQEMLKMGSKTLEFVEKAHGYAHTAPIIVPPFMRLDDFDADYADARGFWTLHNVVSQIEDGLNDTQMAAGGEAYQGALLIYKSAKTAADEDVPGAKSIHDDLKKSFPRTGRKKKSEQPE